MVLNGASAAKLVDRAPSEVLTIAALGSVVRSQVQPGGPPLACVRARLLADSGRVAGADRHDKSDHGEHQAKAGTRKAGDHGEPQYLVLLTALANLIS
ncbi:MAG TPA: hypothetical protein VMA95_19670 [Streptosporangiaceae bacterium]|nr:hypothetical protein [Streptosporangiaceae bacterium]